MQHQAIEQAERELKCIGNDAGESGMFNLIKGESIMKKRILKFSAILTVGIFLLGLSIPSQAAVIADDSFADDWKEGTDGQSDFPGPWTYQAVGYDDRNDTSQYKDLIWDDDNGNWATQSADDNFIDTDWFRLNEPDAAVNTFAIGWKAPEDGQANIVVDGALWRGDGGTWEIGVLDNDGNDLDTPYQKVVEEGSSTDPYEHDFGSFSINKGERIYIYQNESNPDDNDQISAFTELRDAPNGDGIRVTLIPEPSTLALFGLAGLLLMKRRRL